MTSLRSGASRGVAARPFTAAAHALRSWTMRLLAVLAVLACLIARPAHAEGVNGLWVTSTGDYLVLMQDAQSGSTFGFQVPADLGSLRVWMGSGSATVLDLRSLADPTDTLQASATASAISGSTSIDGRSQSLAAHLALAWVATEYAGVWQKSTGSNDYLVFCQLNAGGTKLGVQIDVSIGADMSYTVAVYTGALVGSSFTGVSLSGSGTTSRLTFGAGTLTGQTLSAGRPPVSTGFSATQIVPLSP